MKSVIIIDSFTKVQFDNQKKPLVICDIDYTFLQPKYDYDYYYKLLEPKYFSVTEHHQMTLDMLDAAINCGFVKQTDPEGFSLMLEKIKLLNGNLIFLTARSSVAHIKTLSDLKNAGLEKWDSSQIHYTNNQINKADYIKSEKLLDGYDQIIYIDDHLGYINSALNLFPYIDCYLFKCNL